MIKIQHIIIYAVVVETDADVTTLCSFYTRRDAEEFVRYFASKVTFGGGDVLTKSNGYMSLIDYNGRRCTVWVTEQRLTTMEQLSREGRL